jgi:hypothetical protein
MNLLQKKSFYKLLALYLVFELLLLDLAGMGHGCPRQPGIA